ncbi:MAG: 1-(5-phosphoribosyl)-5-[(5-phosphoribosylamino)methylideneamino]imidazole-4-carboxamide isomerase [Myxococcota bacterium]
MELIPCIDLRDGKVVRLLRGDFDRETVYDTDPAAVARRLAESGAPRLHLVDLDAARDGVSDNGPVIRAVMKAIAPTPVQVGGGLRTVERVTELLEGGADRVVIGTAALEEPEVLKEAASRFPGRVVLGLDTRQGKVSIRGWRTTSDLTPREVVRRFEALPLAAILHTDIAQDGTLEGPNLEGTVALARTTSHPVIASGGIGSLADLLALARTRVIGGAILGRALYTGRVELRSALRELERC